ncbi:MAG: hypothetical protein WDN49_07420 [Acetobacteraceae bacterium]
MSRRLIQYLLSTAVVATVAFGAAGAASAAPVTNIASSGEAQAAASHSLTQSVHWVRRGHRRVWVPDRRPTYHRR